MTDIVGGQSYQARHPDWAQVSNDFARDFFRPDGFRTPFADVQYCMEQEETWAGWAIADLQFDLGTVPVFINGGARENDGNPGLRPTYADQWGVGLE